MQTTLTPIPGASHVRVDFDCIGRGFIDMLPPNERGILAIGMIPDDYWQLLIQPMHQRIEQAWSGYTQADRQWVESETAKAIYRNAEMIV